MNSISQGLVLLQAAAGSSSGQMVSTLVTFGLVFVVFYFLIIRPQRKRVKADGYVTTIFGRRINFPNANSSHAAERSFVERASINAPIQGSAADIIRRAMIRMEPELNKAGIEADMLLQVHDELIFEVPAGTEDVAMPVIKRVMESAAEPAVRLSVPIQVDAHAAHNWDEAH